MISSARLLSQIQRQDTFLWNRNINHEDFLTVRIGVGAIKSPNELKIPKQRFSLDDDALADLPRQVYERHEMMVQTPKTLDLREHKIIGVIGEKSFLNQMSNSLNYSGGSPAFLSGCKNGFPYGKRRMGTRVELGKVASTYLFTK